MMMRFLLSMDAVASRSSSLSRFFSATSSNPNSTFRRTIPDDEMLASIVASPALTPTAMAILQSRRAVNAKLYAYLSSPAIPFTPTLLSLPTHHRHLLPISTGCLVKLITKLCRPRRCSSPASVSISSSATASDFLHSILSTGSKVETPAFNALLHGLAKDDFAGMKLLFSQMKTLGLQPDVTKF